ncbi:MAG: hypothetical protein HQL07_16235 [Nitrospirae bacterium]|nr:hypothetical protein [Magnetococcales bacterium]
MNLQTPIKVQKPQTALHAKAKEVPDCRFHALYDKVYREDVLMFAYRICRSNGGSPGVDGQTFADIKEDGEERWLSALAEDLREKKYRPEAVKRVNIPKPNGKTRPLGIPTIRDRVVQTAAKLVLEPIFEADLQPQQYGYRPNRNAQGNRGTLYAFPLGCDRKHFGQVFHAVLSLLLLSILYQWAGRSVYCSGFPGNGKFGILSQPPVENRSMENGKSI